MKHKRILHVCPNCGKSTVTKLPRVVVCGSCDYVMKRKPIFIDDKEGIKLGKC